MACYKCRWSNDDQTCREGVWWSSEVINRFTAMDLPVSESLILDGQTVVQMIQQHEVQLRQGCADQLMIIHPTDNQMMIRSAKWEVWWTARGPIIKRFTAVDLPVSDSLILDGQTAVQMVQQNEVQLRQDWSTVDHKPNWQSNDEQICKVRGLVISSRSHYMISGGPIIKWFTATASPGLSPSL